MCTLLLHVVLQSMTVTRCRTRQTYITTGGALPAIQSAKPVQNKIKHTSAAKFGVTPTASAAAARCSSKQIRQQQNAIYSLLGLPLQECHVASVSFAAAAKCPLALVTYGAAESHHLKMGCLQCYGRMHFDMLGCAVTAKCTITTSFAVLSVLCTFDRLWLCCYSRLYLNTVTESAAVESSMLCCSAVLSQDVASLLIIAHAATVEDVMAFTCSVPLH